MRQAAAGLLLVALLAGVAAGETEALRLDWPEVLEKIPDLLVYGLPEVRSDEAEDPVHAPVDLIRRPYSREAIDRLIGDAVRARGGEVVLTDDAIHVTGPQAAIALAKRRWAAVTRFVTGRARLTVALFELPVDAAATDAAKLAESLAKTPERLVWTGRFETIRGQTAVRESVTSHPFVMRHEAEIAQWAAIVEPKTGVLVTGRRVSVQCRPLSSREAVVTLSLHLSADPDGMEPVDLQGGTIHLPVVRFLSVLTEMRLAPGRPEMILLPHPTRDGHLAVVVTVDDLPSDVDRPDGLFDVVALAGHPGAAIPTARDHDRRHSTPLGGTPILDHLARIEDRGLRVEDLSHSVFLVLGGPAERDEVPSREDPVVLHRERRSLPWAALLKRPDFDPIRGTVATGTGVLESRLMAPVGAGTPFHLVRGTWRRILASLDAEIAQGAAIAEPVVRDHFEGESLRVRQGGGGVSIHRRTRVLLAKERRDPGVFKDIEGRRGPEAGHLIDVLRVARTEARLSVSDDGKTVDLRREGDVAVMETFFAEAAKPQRSPERSRLQSDPGPGRRPAEEEVPR